MQQEEQKLSSLRVEAASQGFGHIILCGIGSAGTGPKLLETMLGEVPLAAYMKHFISMHAATLDPAFLELCQMQQRKWQEQEGDLRRLRDTLIATSQSRSACQTVGKTCP
jgi:hypothetical protein